MLRDRIKEALKPTLRGSVDRWTKDNFELWVDMVAEQMMRDVLRSCPELEKMP